ncbi:hemagglutinin protein [uncultured Aquimarina sp.]|uniref:hemagglutinin protein n=1 Tax=uncultured Aquimarina sp. TaxID=575652 RepID=UPI0026040DC0|nr:hemagglutinin protein [uncultured Aquimarina sp.]
MNRIFTLMMVVIGVISTQAQSIERQVIGSAGTTVNNGSVTMDFTIGDLAVTVITDGSTKISQGFHQGSLLLAIKINPVAFIQGAALNPNNGEESLMRDDLRVADHIPTTSPYADALTVQNSVLTTTGANAIVDWIFVELRDAVTNTTIVASQSALLQRDGDIVGVDGVSDLEFDLTAGDYYVALKHRNHLGIMTDATVALSDIVTTLDFTDGSVNIYGTNAQTTFGMPSGVSAMWAGDANGDGKVNLIGSSNDSNTIRDVILNDPINLAIQFYGFNVTGYNDADTNLTGGTQIIGINNDASLVRDNILNHPFNTFIQFYGFNITEQLPAEVNRKRIQSDIALLEKVKALEAKSNK